MNSHELDIPLRVSYFFSHFEVIKHHLYAANEVMFSSSDCHENSSAESLGWTSYIISPFHWIPKQEPKIGFSANFSLSNLTQKILWNSTVTLADS